MLWHWENTHFFHLQPSHLEEGAALHSQREVRDNCKLMGPFLTF